MVWKKPSLVWLQDGRPTAGQRPRRWGCEPHPTGRKHTATWVHHLVSCELGYRESVAQRPSSKGRACGSTRWGTVALC